MSGAPPDDPGASHEDVLPARVRTRLERDFIIEGEVGRGGMATVWRATRRSDNASVAIKVLRPVLAEAIGSKRFLREIEIAAGTHSELLVPLQESGEAEGLPYYVMPFIDGESLRQRLRRERQLPISEAVRIGRSIALALAALHRDGIVHRDVKPENVLLRGEDVLVADYGIARALTAAVVEQITSTGVVVGTPAYMSPEQAGGDAVDARSDQYALGCVLYEMLIGLQPFQGATTQALIARHMRENVPSLRLVRPAIPESLETVVLKAMGKLPADRFGNIEGLVAALDRVDVRGLSPSQSVEHRWRRVAAIASVAAAAAAAWYGWQWKRPPLDTNRVALFPLVAVDTSWQPAAARASLSIRRALEDIEPDRWIDDASLRDGETGTMISARRARSLTRRARARFYVTSTVEHSGAATDSARVTVTLNDLEQQLDTTVVALGAASALADVALNAVVRLLPRLTGLERQIHPASLFGRAPAVVSNWLRGEHEYRSSRINSSLDYLRRALAADSSLAPAALRAAMASMWLDDEREASQLVGLAQRHRGMLSGSQAAFAEALRLYLLGAADSAVVAVRHAIAAEPTRAEPWMLTGEIYRHLLPAVPLDSQLVRVVPEEVTLALDSLAEYSHRRSRVVDPGFSPPLAHLAEAAARRADLGTLDSLLRELREAKADSTPLARLTLVQRCLTKGMTPADWSSETRAEAGTVHGVGVVMSGASALRARACAENAWSALRNADDASMRWAALVAKLGLHAAAGESHSALALIDSAVASGMSAALGLYILAASAGIDPGTRADAFVSQLDSAINSRPAPSLWLLTLWSARTADTTRLAKVRARLETLKSVNRTHLDTLIADVAGAYQALARRDTIAALKAFGALAPRAPRSVLEGSLWETLATERLVYARLLLATGSPGAAHRVASVFDQPGFYVNTLFLRPSLEIRAEAARTLGRERLRLALQDRLRQLSPQAR